MKTIKSIEKQIAALKISLILNEKDGTTRLLYELYIAHLPRIHETVVFGNTRYNVDDVVHYPRDNRLEIRLSPL